MSDDPDTGTGAGSCMQSKEDTIAENRARCICNPCPSYNECMRAADERVFCIRGKSPTCTFDKKGCTCPNCPVWQAMGFKKSYYCIRGSELEQK